MPDHASALSALRRSVLESAGSLTPEVRRRIYEGEPVDSPLDGFLSLVRSDSVKLSRKDIHRLKDQGLSEDEIFEATLAAALGRADRTLQAGLRSLGATG